MCGSILVYLLCILINIPFLKKRNEDKYFHWLIIGIIIGIMLADIALNAWM